MVQPSVEEHRAKHILLGSNVQLLPDNATGSNLQAQEVTSDDVQATTSRCEKYDVMSGTVRVAHQIFTRGSALRTVSRAPFVLGVASKVPTNQ